MAEILQISLEFHGHKYTYPFEVDYFIMHNGVCKSKNEFFKDLQEAKKFVKKLIDMV